MTLFIVYIWNGEKWEEDSETTFMIVEANSGTEAGDKVTELLEVVALNEKGKIKEFNFPPLQYYDGGKVTHTKPLDQYILECKEAIISSKELYKNYLEENKNEC